VAKKGKRVIDLDRLRATEKIRYSRAVLTVEQWVSVHHTPVEEALRTLRKGQASPDDVAWAFVKQQVTAHTPSFDWADADLGKLLPRVAAVTKVPKLKAQTPDQLVPELEEIETKEREAWKKAGESISTAILPTLPKIVPSLSDDFLKMYRPEIPKLPISEAARLQILQTNKKLAETVKANPNFQAPGMVDPKVIESLRPDLEKIRKMIRPEIPPLGLDPDLLNQLTGFQPGGEWFESLKQLAEAAREAGAPEAAEAAEVTLGESELEPFEIDLEEVYKRLKELFEQLAPEDSSRRRVIEGLILHFMIRFIENVAAGG
jgi:hypothetical protein